MRRLTTGLFALVLFATACGSGDDAEDILVELGLSETEAACFDREYEARGLDMNDMLTADTDELSSEELQTVLDVASICSGGSGAIADNDDDTSADSDSGDDSDDDSDDTGSSDGERRAYDDLSLLEQAFVDGITESGGTTDVGICMLDEFEAAGISILDLAELGLDDSAQPSEDFMAAIFRCGEELAESGFFNNAGDFFSSPAEGDDYGDNAELDALYDACSAGDGEACDELYWSSPVGSAYEAYGNTCGDRFPDGAITCSTAMAGESDDAAMNYGDDPDLDALYDACGAGDLDSCDSLYLTSPIGSEYETFGSTCGGAQEPTFGQCNFSDAFTYGDDAGFDALWDACAVGDLDSCDELYLSSPFGSEYEAFGSTCGDTDVERFGQCANPGPFTYGDDAELDALWDGCANGDLAACDTLWLTSPIDSDYEAFGGICGGLVDENQFGGCEAALSG